MILQNIHQDPNVPDIFDILLNKPDIREQVLQSSMICPIHLSADGHYSNHYLYSHIDSLLPILLQGRFIIRYLGDDIMAEKIVEKLNRLRKDL
jgi:cytochrome oxidase Cu insertion factor (SCO1/SenC/PrrC family)